MASQDSQPFHWRYNELDDKNFQMHGRALFFIVVLVCIALLITLLFLYARWICRLRPLNAISNSPLRHPHTQPPQPQGLDHSAISRLPIVLFRSSPIRCGINESECCICLSIFQNGDKLKVLPECHHLYHSDCVDNWLRTHSNCPLCRATLRVDSPV